MLRMLEVPDWGLESWSWFGYDHWSLIYQYSKCLLISWFWRCKEHTCPLSPSMGLWRKLEVPEWGLTSFSWFVNNCWSLVHTCSNFGLTILILKMQRTYISFKSWFGAFENIGYIVLEDGILISIWKGSTIFETTYEGAKNILVLQVLIWGFRGHWRFLFRVLHLDFDFDMVTGFWYTFFLNFGSLSLFWRFKEHPCPSSPDLGL